MYTQEQYIIIAIALKTNLFCNFIHNILRTALDYYVKKDFVKSDACINDALKCTHRLEDIENLKTILGIK